MSQISSVTVGGTVVALYSDTEDPLRVAWVSEGNVEMSTVEVTTSAPGAMALYSMHTVCTELGSVLTFSRLSWVWAPHMWMWIASASTVRQHARRQNAPEGVGSPAVSVYGIGEPTKRCSPVARDPYNLSQGLRSSRFNRTFDKRCRFM